MLVVGVVSGCGSSVGITATADQFQPQAGWELANERVEPPRLICLGDVPCPSLQRRWQTSTPVTPADPASAARHWDLTLPDRCDPDPDTYGPQTICEATGTTGDYTVRVWVTVDVTTDAPHVVTLSLQM